LQAADHRNVYRRHQARSRRDQPHRRRHGPLARFLRWRQEPLKRDPGIREVGELDLEGFGRAIAA
jgi:hypothetical protein